MLAAISSTAADDKAAQVRELNNSVLQLHGQMQSAAAAERAALRTVAAPILAKRAAALAALIASDPRQAVQLAFPPDVLADLAKQIPSATAALESHGTWSGVAEVNITDFADGSHRTDYRLRTASAVLELHFAQPEPAVLSGYAMSVNGVTSGTTTAVTSSTTTSSTTPACSPIGQQNVGVVMVNYPGATLPANITQQSLQDAFFGTANRSVDGYWREVSHGQTWAAGDVYGPYNLSGSYASCNITQMRDDAIAAAFAAGVDLTGYNRLFFVFPNGIGCGWSGLSSLGCPAISGPSGTITASTEYLSTAYTNMDTNDHAVGLAIHEGGHGLGLNHASIRDFYPDVAGPLGATGTLTEYGDPFSTMGHGTLGYYGAPHQAERLNWMAPGSGYQVVQSSGTYTIQPLESSAAGLQALKVQRGTGNDAWLWIEYRQPLGNYDPTLQIGGFGGALVHYEDPITGTWTHMLDFTPSSAGTWDAPLLLPGASWVDPYTNVSLRVQSATATALTVEVQYGSYPCVLQNPTLSIGPLNPSVYAGGSVQYTATVTNNDTQGCSAASFALDSAQPSGWASSFSTSLVTLNPGQSASVTMTKSVPAGTAAATYAVDAHAANGAYVGSATGNCTVMTAPAVSVSLSSSSSSYTRRNTVVLTAKAVSGSSPAAGATVAFTMTLSNGAKVSGTAVTDSTGTATWRYKLNSKMPTGAYSGMAQTTLNSQTVTSNSVTFSVQ